jgi:hypothetical protein
VKYCGAKLSLQTEGPANYHSVGMPLPIFYAAACGSHSALGEKAMKRVASMMIMSKGRDVSPASIFNRRRTLAVMTGANRG